MKTTPSSVRRLYFILVALVLSHAAKADQASLSLFEDMVIGRSEAPGAFPLVIDQKAAPLWFDANDHPGVLRAIQDLRRDIKKVTGIDATTTSSLPPASLPVLIGTIGKCAPIDQLIADGKLDPAPLVGKWESFTLAVVSHPLPGVAQAFVIAGSDKRGTIYGIYELSRQIGVSPWHWWADVPAQSRSELLLKPGSYSSGEPAVKYRGIFINDEAPALRRWAEEKFGGLSPEFYGHVYELLLRCRANYLWPAMWLPTSFNDDYPDNPKRADEYGIIVSTSHHEPMMRSHHEWVRYGNGPWNYETNAAKLLDYWRGGLERVRTYEGVVTVGMRGDGDEAMSEGTAVPLLKRIIHDQRQVISEVFGKPASQVPQVWALYKEVQDYYDKGMRVDDDVLVLFSDDNWGNLRFLPKSTDPVPVGGYGMYYHLDYVGAPVSYRWLNVTQIERVWEQMTLAYTAGVRGLWIANVGDIKPMEFPLSFFLDLAWKPEALQADDLPRYYLRWASEQFGPSHAHEIAELLRLYTKYNARRTPEMLEANTYSAAHYREADRVDDEFQNLAVRARRIKAALPAAQQDAYAQLVLYPIEASANVTALYVAAGKNQFYAERGATAANFYAEKVTSLFARDAALTRQFHEEIAGGKWRHMMSQTHLGYTSWSHPPLNRTPPVTFVAPLDQPTLGFLVEHGSRPKWGWLDVEADWDFDFNLPLFDRTVSSEHFVDVINRGGDAVSYQVDPVEDWIKVSPRSGSVRYHEKVQVAIDWEKAPLGRSVGSIRLTGAGADYTLNVPIRNESHPVVGFLEKDGVVSVEAHAFDRLLQATPNQVVVIPNLGRTGSAVTLNPARPSQALAQPDAPRLEYDFTLSEKAKVSLHTYLSPTQDFLKHGGLTFAIAVDDSVPQVINLNAGEEVPDWKYAEWWMKSVGDHIKIRRADPIALDAGPHTLKLWLLDPGVVVQKIVIDAGGLKPSYLGPPSSPRHESQ